jgi:uncharacterized protein (DUF58 family)
MKWYLIVGIFLLAAMVLQLGFLVYALAVLLAVMLGSRFLAAAGIEQIAAERTCSLEAAEVGDVLRVRLRIRNAGRLPMAWLLVEDVLPPKPLSQRPPALKLEGRPIRIMTMWPGQERTLEYAVHFHRHGYYQIGPVLLESGDLFGLYRRYRIAREPHFVLVYPRVVPLRSYDLASRRPIGEVLVLHRLYEDPTRIAGVRSYQYGDPLNRIHWRATARTLTLHSKVYEPSTIAGATLLLDLHRDSYPERGEPYRSGLAVTTAASLAYTLCHLNQQVGLVTNGRDAAERIRVQGWDGDYRTRSAARQHATPDDANHRLQPLVVPTNRGPDQFPRILQTLARAELNDGLTLPELVREAGHHLPRDATVVALLASVTPETALCLGSLRRRGYAVTAILILFLDPEREAAFARLLAEGIEVRHLQNEAELAQLCERHSLR